MEIKLNRLTACFAFIFNKNYYDIRGFLDSDAKVQCAFLAKELLGYSWLDLGKYYSIDRWYLRNKMNDVKIEVELSDHLALMMSGVRQLWRLMEVNGVIELDTNA